MTRHDVACAAERDLRLLHCGDTAFTVEFGDRIDRALTERVLALDARLAGAGLVGIVETVPTYRSLTVYIDPSVSDPRDLGHRVLALAEDCPNPRPERRQWRVPVLYGGAFGLDLESVAEHHRLTPADVIERHASVEYQVAMIGFLPGYVYLSGMDPGLALSRRPNPRPVTPAGTISIGGAQALIASIAAPSGWHLLGQTPVRTFLPGRDPTFLLEPGDSVRFEPIEADRWDALDRAAATGELVAEWTGG